MLEDIRPFFRTWEKEIITSCQKYFFYYEKVLVWGGGAVATIYPHNNYKYKSDNFTI